MAINNLCLFLRSLSALTVMEQQQQHFSSNVNTAGLVYLREGATAVDTASPGTPPLSRQQPVTTPSSIAAAASAASLLLRQHGGGAAAAAMPVVSD